MRVSLELNFVNHILPSGGVSGVSYTNWRMGKFGVSAAQSMMAQAVRYAAGFGATIVLLFLSLFVVTIDGNVNRWIILMSAFLVMSMIMAVAFFVYIVKSPSRIHRLGNWLQRMTNRIARAVTGGRRRQMIDAEKVVEVFDDIHHDCIELNREKSVLWHHFIWCRL